MTKFHVETAEDVVSFLKEQHQQIKDLFAEVEQNAGTMRSEAFTALRRLLAVHETAEELIVHPRARHEIENGEAIVADRLREENEAKATLAELEGIEDVDSDAFGTKLAKLHTAVLAHAEAEETQEFNQLLVELDDAQLSRMRKAVELAEAVGPTRPHAGVESQSANLLAGPFASMLDRARDLISMNG